MADGAATPEPLGGQFQQTRPWYCLPTGLRARDRRLGAKAGQQQTPPQTLITLGNEDPVGCLEYKQKSYRSLVLNAAPNTRSRKKCKILKKMQDLAENARYCKKMQGLA